MRYCVHFSIREQDSEKRDELLKVAHQSLKDRCHMFSLLLDNLYAKYKINRCTGKYR